MPWMVPQQRAVRGQVGRPAGWLAGWLGPAAAWPAAWSGPCCAAAPPSTTHPRLPLLLLLPRRYIVGGLVGSTWGWRAPFALEAAVTAPLAAVSILGRPPRRTQSAAAAAAAVAASGGGGLWGDLRQLLSSAQVVLTVLGLSLYNGSLGGFTFYGEAYLR